MNLPFLKISVGANAALALALGFVMLRADAISADRDTQVMALQMAADRHLVTRTSLDQCISDMNHIIADGAGRDDRLAQAAAEQLRRSQELRDEADRILREAPSGQCRTPNSILRSKNL